MTIKNNRPAQAAELRHQAEAKWGERSKKTGPLPATESDTRRLVHELQVHQIELEMQNEELMQSRAETEAALRQYTDLYDFAPVGYFTLARDGAIRQANLAGANLLGVERSKLIKRRFGLFVSVESRPAFSAFLEKVFSTSGSKEAREIALLKDGADPLWVHFEATISVASGVECEACQAVVINITERKRAEEALRKKDEHYRNVIESIFRFVPEGLLVLSKDFSPLKQNKAFGELVQQYAAQLGYTEQELAELITEQVRRKILSEDTTEIQIPKKRL